MLVRRMFADVEADIYVPWSTATTPTIPPPPRSWYAA